MSLLVWNCQGLGGPWSIRSLGDLVREHGKPWRFEPGGLQSPQCEEVVRQGWISALALLGRRSLGAQIEHCQTRLSQWSTRVFKKDKQRVQRLEKRLSLVLHSPMTTAQQHEASAIRKELKDMAAFEETSWRQRSKALWLKEGDRNTGFFHRKASHMFQTNRISKLRNSTAAWLTETDDIQQSVVEYFRSVYACNRPRNEDIARGGSWG
ncbi:UNVERIFIED_CONTAM: hypothetical protein Slati_1053800 [Sesamum latifolium]|uniref:Uncharacterized protein n=1 Tax=Sesamum latifolium TaxID=2727402 RepID=A0AAW2XTR0_9LAMI